MAEDPPTSAEINRAIETLRAAGLHPARMNELDLWNARRLRAAADGVQSREDIQRLIEGISERTLARAGIT